MSEYPDVSAFLTTFSVTIDPCVATYTESFVEDQFYGLGDAPLDIEFYDFTQTPECGYDQTFVIEINNNGVIESLPDWFTFSGLSPVRVFTENPSDVGAYTVRITGTLNDDSLTTTFLEFQLTVADSCGSVLANLDASAV